MKTLVKRLIALLPFILAANVYGQIVNVPGIGSAILREQRYTDVEGSPFIYQGWKPGAVTDRNGKLYLNQLIKYDTHRDELQVNQDGSTLALDKFIYPKFDIAFTEDNSTTTIQRKFQSGFKVEGFLETSYFEVLYDGAYKFLKKTKTDFMDQNVTSYGTNTAVKKFITRETYYIVDRTGKSFLIRLNKKSLLEAVGGDKESVEAYIENSKSKVRSEKDFTRILSTLQ